MYKKIRIRVNNAGQLLDVFVLMSNFLFKVLKQRVTSQMESRASSLGKYAFLTTTKSQSIQIDGHLNFFVISRRNFN